MGFLDGRSLDGGLDNVPLVDVAGIEHVAGALWLCGKRVVGPDPEAALVRASADALVCFQEVHEVERDHPGYADWLRRHDGGKGLWFPIPDLGAPPIERAEEITAVLVGRLRDGDGLVLHCAGGIGRAPTMATLALIDLGVKAEHAGVHVAAHRPMAGPEAGVQAELVTAFARRRSRQR